MVFHQELSAGRWSELSLAQQLGNVGSEVNRMIKWRHKDKDMADRAFERTLELLDLTLSSLHNKYRLREIARVREILVSSWLTSTPKSNFELDQLNKYFFQFALLARS
ncbi:hypothetical protein KKE14_02245 [Patescibacteria group bacterium]|nr:hypothetical protein [Patescibacteria group bacterium]